MHDKRASHAIFVTTAWFKHLLHLGLDVLSRPRDGVVGDLMSKTAGQVPDY